MTKPSTQDLPSIAHSNQTAEVVFTALALRERARETTDLRRFKNSLINSKERIVPADFLAVFKALETRGIGKLTYGARGAPHRFHWNISMKDVGRMALEGKRLGMNVPPKGLPPVTALKQVPVSALRRKASAEALESVQTIMVVLPASGVATIEIPSNITDKDREALSAALSKLLLNK